MICPILLYHRIGESPTRNEYYVTVENFRAQMQALKDWGYTPIPMSLLLQAMREGAPLPERPVVISFDDGDITVYTEAFPIMQEFGFVGINYLVANRLTADGFMNRQQIHELADAGWEVGSHSYDHSDLTAPEGLDLQFQISESRRLLEEQLGLPVQTFAYPFGRQNEGVLSLARRNYEAAVGLGPLFKQDANNLYYLWRRPVKYEWDVQTFGSFLPWNTAP